MVQLPAELATAKELEEDSLAAMTFASLQQFVGGAVGVIHLTPIHSGLRMLTSLLLYYEGASQLLAGHGSRCELLI